MQREVDAMTPVITWIKVCDAAALGDQESRCFRGAGLDIALFNVQGRYFALADRCPHGNASLSEGWLEDGKIECPLHQARFEVATGRVLCGPARENARIFDVRVEAGAVFIALDDTNEAE